MKIDDKAITAQLAEIRRKVGGSEIMFTPRPYPERIEVDLDEKSVKSLFHPSGLLIYNNRPVFAYIRDHIGHYADNPHERKKIHFTVCQTLREMENAGRFESRYRATNRDDNLYPIDVGSGRGSERLVTLYPCRHCLKKSNYLCFDYAPENRRWAIVKEFDAKMALNLLWQHFDVFRKHAEKLRSAAGSTGYLPNQPQISRAYRAEKKFICEECGVNLKRNSRLTDTHHIDRDKRNNRDENLQCLCKLCHAKKHPHYRVSESDRREIENARRLRKM